MIHNSAINPEFVPSPPVSFERHGPKDTSNTLFKGEKNTKIGTDADDQVL